MHTFRYASTESVTEGMDAERDYGYAKGNTRAVHEKEFNAHDTKTSFIDHLIWQSYK